MPDAWKPTNAALALLLLASAIPYLVNLGASSIWDANEAFYAQTPREMIDGSDYVNPSFNFQLRFNKPVFSYWEVAAAYRVFGISERSERIPIALGGLVMIVTALLLGNLIGGLQAGLIAALVLATSPRMLLLARRIIIDVNIAMLTGLVLLFFSMAETYHQRRRLFLVLMYVAAGFGVLTKGPVAVFLPAVVFFIYLASQRRLRDLKSMRLVEGALIGLAIVVPWYYMVYRDYGWQYIRSFIVGENLQRYASAVGEQARGPLFYLPVMFADLFPWSLFIPVALLRGFRERSRPVSRLSVIWIIAIVAFFSMSGTKEDLYILPIVTAEAALIGATLAALRSPTKVHSQRSGTRTLDWASVATGVMLLLVGAAMVWAFYVSHRYSVKSAALVGAIAVIGGTVVSGAALKRQTMLSAVATCTTLIVISYIVVLASLPDFERYKPVKPFCAIIQSRASTAGVVGYYKFALPSMVYYLNRPVMEIEVPDHLRAVLSSSEDAHVIMPELEYERVKDRLPAGTSVLARQPMFDLRPKNFLSGSELPQFVLVSNRP